MRKRKNKALVAAIISAAIACNGFVALSPKAYADEAANASSAYLTEVVNKKLGSLVLLAYAYSDEEYDMIESRLNQGESLVQASRTHKDTLLSQILDSIKQELALDADTGRIASDQVATLVEQAKPIIEEAITKPGGTQATTFNFEELLNERLSTLQLAAMTYSDEDDDEVRNRLERGETLLQATRMQQHELLDKLLAPVNQEIEHARAMGWLTTEDADAKKTEARKIVAEAISTPGGSKTAAFNFNSVLNNRLASLTMEAIAYSDDDDEDVKDRLEQGESLARATRMQQSELLDRLIAPVNKKISNAVAFGAITAEDAAEYTAQARKAISEAITTPGGMNGPSSSVLDTQAFLNEKLSDLAIQAYAVADNDDLELSDLREGYAAGESLTSLTGLSSEELANRIADQWKSDLKTKGVAQDQIDAFLPEAIKELKAAIK